MMPGITAKAHSSFLPGLDVLAQSKNNWVNGRRIGLVSHPAAVSARGAPAAAVLAQAGAKLAALFGPEHGFFGTESAGKQIADFIHPQLKIPVYSLFGATKQPTDAMLEKLDALVFDMQDLGARFYTYVSTLRYILEAAARKGKTAIVLDRPIPLPNALDGPLLDGRFTSFIACIPAPMSYGMTPGEAALWMKESLGLDLDLKVAPMRGYRRESRRGPGWPPWIPTSPGIRTWETAYCYFATVCSEALSLLNIGRGSNMIFQVISLPGIGGERLAKSLNGLALPGVAFYPHPYKTDLSNEVFDGVRIAVYDPNTYRPIATAVALVAEIQKIAGLDALWHHPGTRPEWFDKLFGTDLVRRALQSGRPAGEIAESWQADLRLFQSQREPFLLYQPGP